MLSNHPSERELMSADAVRVARGLVGSLGSGSQKLAWDHWDLNSFRILEIVARRDLLLCVVGSRCTALFEPGHQSDTSFFCVL
jgi:hypothetical protein